MDRVFIVWCPVSFKRSEIESSLSRQELHCIDSIILVDLLPNVCPEIYGVTQDL